MPAASRATKSSVTINGSSVAVNGNIAPIFGSRFSINGGRGGTLRRSRLLSAHTLYRNTSPVSSTASLHTRPPTRKRACTHTARKEAHTTATPATETRQSPADAAADNQASDESA
eukprot:2340223-Rhodomonas_salina.1